MGAEKKAGADRQVEISGKTYTLRFSVRAMVALQDHYGFASLDEVGQRLADTAQFGARDLVAVLWAGLRTHHAEIGMDDALDLLDDIGLAEMQTVIGDAFGAAAVENKEGGEDDRP